MNQESVFIKLWRSPHSCFCTNNLFDVAHQCWSLSSFRSERVHYDVVPLAVNLEVINCPIRSDLSWRVDHDVPVRKLPFGLIWSLHPPIDDLPTGRRIDH